MARRNYKFTDKKHTKQGLASSALGLLALGLTAVSLLISYQKAGEAGSVTGLLGLLSMLAAAVGFTLAVRGFREEDVYYLTAQTGVVINGVLLILWALVCVIGM